MPKPLVLLSLRISPELHHYIQAQAVKKETSVNAWIAQLIKERMERDGK